MGFNNQFQVPEGELPLPNFLFSDDSGWTDVARKITNREKPLSFGISLQNLSMQTTDQYWVPCLHDETEKLVRKLIRLDNLFAYWNVQSQMFYLNDYDESLDDLKNGIVNENIIPQGYDFVFRPISAKGKLQMNRRSDFDFSDPKINLEVELHNIAIEFNKPQELEKALDVFNITIARQQAEVEVKKAGYKIYRQGMKDPEDKKGWFNWLWTWSESHTKQQPDVKPGILEEMLTPEEKVLLYEAIGYSETAVDPTLPKTFEAMKFFVHLKSMSIVLRENNQKPELIDIVVEEFSTLIVQRPGAQAIKFETKIDSFHITGLPDNSKKPRLLSSLDGTSLFQIIFEINPLDETVSQRCIIEAEPLEMIYDARTVNSIMEFFRPPKEVHLAQLTSATLTKLEEFRDKTATGLLYIIETQKVLDLRINLKASYIIVPQDGIFTPTSNLLLLDLGHLKVASKIRSELPDVKHGGANLEEIMQRAYDSFDIHLTSIQLLYSRVGDNWKEARKLNVSTQHILVPMHFNVELSKAMVFMDLRMPKFKIFGELPLVSLRISDKKLQGIMELVESIPKPVLITDVSAPVKSIQIQASTGSGPTHISQKIIPILELPYITEDDENKKPVYLVTTLDNTMEDLLTLEYVKVNFSSLDIHLHTEALLNTMNYLNNILPQSVEKRTSVSVGETEDKGDVIKKLALKLSMNEDIITLQILAELSCLRIFIQDQKHNISEIKIEGLDSEMIMRTSVVEINAKLRNIIVLDSDIMAVYKKAVYITGKEVFSFKLVFYMDVTAGSADTDMNVVDVQVNLTVGCIEVVFVTKFLYSIMAFIDNFQAAKQALAEATVQAAGMAATGVKELAQRSSRMALDIHIKAPVVVIPQSPVSENVFVADFGLITMKNKFILISESQSYPPPVIDLITIKLSEMRLYRSQYINGAYQEVLDLLLPLNLEVVVERNMSWSWYQEIPCFNVNAQLKPMEFILSQEDLTTTFKTLYGNIWYQGFQASSAEVKDHSSNAGGVINASPHSGGATVVTAAVVEVHSHASQVKTTLNMTFKTDYLTMILYSPGPEQAFTDVRDPSLKLAEFKLENIISTLKICTDESTFSSFSLRNCILDDKRPHIKKATPRMIGLTVGFDKKDMMDVKYRKIRDAAVTDAVFQEMYICASVEFLLTVANVFLEAYTAGSVIETNVQTWTSKEAPVLEPEKWEINILIKNPEIVFVADMTRNDAPALVITTQCEICCKGDLKNTTMTAAIKDLQIRACPFLPVKRKGRITTVLQPCDLFYQSTQTGTDPQVIDISVKSLTLKMKKKAKKAIVESDTEEENYKVPEYKTVISFYSKDQLNITLSKCGLVMLSNLVKAFTEAATGSSAAFIRDLAPFMILNCLGLTISVSPSDSFNVLNVPMAKSYILKNMESLSMDYVRSKDNDHFNAMTSLSSKLFFILLTPVNHSTADKIPLTKVGRRLYTVRHRESGVERSIVCQIDAVEGSKKVTIRSPVQGIENTVFTLNEGHSAQVYTVQVDKAKLHLKLLDYLNHDWKSEFYIKSNQQDISFISFACVTDMEKTELDIAIHMTYNTGQTIVAFHSPYWMVNKTSRMLQYKADGIHRKHPPNYKKPVLFSFQPNHFFNTNKVQLMVTDSGLSDQFSIDTVGSHGAVKCKGPKMEYQVGVTINLSSFNITRIVTFTPFYMIKNKSKYHISVAEEGSDKWLSLQLEQCIPFWPEDVSSKLLIQVEKSEGPPKRIYFNKQENCILLRLNNELGGIIAEVNLAEHSTVITFSDYHDGAATFLLINHTKNDLIQYKQSSLSEIEDSLPPGKAVFYTWADPVGSRKLKWSCGKSHGEVTQKDDMMTPINLGKKTIYLVSFFEGLQRIILFTEDPRVFKVTYESEKAELAEQEIVLALQDVGISLVNNYTKEEVAYIGITSSDVVWETKPKKKARWKTMSVKHTEKLEKEFKEYTESSPLEDKVIELDTSIPVCFTPSGNNMKILQPHVQAIRRNYLPALKVEYSTSAHQSSFRIQIYRIQIQNQIHGAIFPFVFYPIKPPKSVTMDSAPKPFTDVSIVMRSAGHSQISRIKYFKVLIQEMDLRLDLGFVYALADLMTEVEGTEITELELFHKDKDAFEEEYETVSLVDQSQVSLYEYFHISPIKLHLSVSLSSGRDEPKDDSEHHGGLIPVHSLNLLLKSIGATLTDVQDVVFKLAFFELNYQFHTTSELQSEVIRHYSKQAIKQMYVLILGLDVLGNPFGLIREFSEGVEAFFYEPYQGAIQGPEEFVEGMALGLRALVGGAVGGLAGAASKITSAMAKGVAAMTMDEDYQQKRREAMNKQPAGLREGITRGGKGLVSGFVSGITGIVTKPIKGAQKEGAAGFFKGVGKGLVGAVARPTGGIIDMASSTFQGIKRATESYEVESLRPPRFFNEDGVIRPYRLRDGTGNQMLQVMENGRFAKYKYFTHVMINKTDMFMITRSGVLFVTKGAFGQLTCEWQYSFDEFTKEPFIIHGRRLRIEAKERVKSVFHAKEFGKIINFKTPEDARWILTKLEEAREPSPSL
ncbi:Vacuolar protein sorting-associated protein 13A [Sciurus carolinensis]|uniref:Vacuolar protein sorting-associated protein 13A n=1 Tax=Sciurus carolinensis TaxID=30640 RepID=A0AA41SQY9_SCICA|nr:Vacuolar protein sorting-associated protein 13A [Sciurus carolinensis]